MEVLFSELVKGPPLASNAQREAALAQINKLKADVARLHDEVADEIWAAQQTLRDTYRTLALSREMGL